VSPRRVPALDGIRGVAIAAVLFCHTWPYPSNFSAAGTLGVDLFFVLSGFLITGILIDTRSAENYFGRFYTRRALRLFPLFYSYLLFLGLFLPAFHRLTQTSMADFSGSWWWYITYFVNWKADSGAGDPYLGHIWSLAVEEQFYLVWPAVVFLLSRRNLTFVCAMLAVLPLLLRCFWIYGQDVDPSRVYHHTFARADSMGVGGLIAIAIRSEAWKERLTKLTVPLGLIGACALILISIAAGEYRHLNPLIRTYGQSAALLAFGAFVYFGATRRHGTLYDVLCSRPLTALGTYSYGIYVIHLMVRDHFEWLREYLARSHGSSPLLDFATFGAINVSSFVLAAASWHWFESPIQRWTPGTIGFLRQGLALKPTSVPSKSS
jgi:peptidoglycan/LPS O-acetylase OafA/YrhL